MQYWLFKSEPDSFSWEMLKKKGKAGQEWDGVRNYTARNNMRAMKIGDLGFCYHSNEGLDIVGIAEVCKLARPPSPGKRSSATISSGKSAAVMTGPSTSCSKTATSSTNCRTRSAFSGKKSTRSSRAFRFFAR